MSLEATLNKTNELLEKLITILLTAQEAQGVFGTDTDAQSSATETPKTRRKRASKDESQEVESPAAAVAAPAEVALPTEAVIPADKPWGVVEGDPVDTRYFVIPAHNAVLRQLPSEPTPSLTGAVRVTAEAYLQKKAEFAALTQSILEAQRAGKTAAQPSAQGATAAPVASSPVAAPAAASQASAEVSFADVVAKLQALMKSNLPGHGREGVVSILKQYLPGEEGPTVPKLETLKKNAEILASVEALLTPAGDLGL